MKHCQMYVDNNNQIFFGVIKFYNKLCNIYMLRNANLRYAKKY